LPIIGVCWDNTVLQNDQILMLSVTNYVGMVVSNICISNLDEAECIYIDSELESCYNQNGTNVNEKISLNGNKFPYLDRNDNIVNVTQYTKETQTVDEYNNLIQNQLSTEDGGICESKYSSQEILILEKQDKFFVPSFQSIIDENDEVYQAQSYESLLDELSESYTVELFNTMLNNYSESFTVNADLENLTLPKWLAGEQESGSSDITLKADKAEFFMTSDNSSDCGKNMLYYVKNDVIVNTKNNKSITFYYYPCKEEEGVSIAQLALDYDDLPDWMEFLKYYIKILMVV
jgi:hypothetical protein